ncbi:hypothetical protein [Janibacter melonis]|uniref:hypothetical protein n=1 Tax=Janibacter melonis TaxID=262209 RepID=UPI002095C9B9|nr:hypothetical protein [Janibacter melonis]
MRGLGATVRGEGGAVVVRAGVRVAEDVGLVGVFDDELFVDELFEEELAEEELAEEDVELLELLEVLRAAGSVVALPMRTPGTVSGAGRSPGPRAGPMRRPRGGTRRLLP